MTLPFLHDADRFAELGTGVGGSEAWGRTWFGSFPMSPAANGAPHLRHLDPRARTLEVFKRQDQNCPPAHAFIDREDVSSPPADAIPFRPGQHWPFDQPTSEPKS